MEVVIDKFGRILIPKKLRKFLGLQPGQRLKLIADPSAHTLQLVPEQHFKAILKPTNPLS